MRSPEGQDMPLPGVYLEVVKNERIVFTDAYKKAWEPSGKPFFTGVVTFEDLGNGTTRYTARGIGTPPIAIRTRRWASTRAGASARISWRRWRRRSESFLPLLR